MRFITRLRDRLAQSVLPDWARPALAGLAMGVLAHFAPSLLGPGLDTIAAMLQGEVPTGNLVVLLVLKILATGLCLAMVFHGGIVAPALFIGAAWVV